MYCVLSADSVDAFSDSFAAVCASVDEMKVVRIHLSIGAVPEPKVGLELCVCLFQGGGDTLHTHLAEIRGKVVFVYGSSSALWSPTADLLGRNAFWV
jgi:hypothetical protein